MDTMTRYQRSLCMSNVKGKDTGLEKLFRKNIAAMGIRGYRLHASVSGKPDVYFPKRKLAVFIDGCFWHGCPRCYTQPATNRKFWTDKITNNMNRDEIVNRELRRAGIKVIRFWGHDVKKDPARCAEKLLRTIVSLK